MIYKCDWCHNNTNEYNKVILDGTDDIYTLEVCNKCCEILSDYYSPEDVDAIFA